MLNQEIVFTDHDLQEPDADQETIVGYKIGQLLQMYPGQTILAEDTALYIDGSDVGVNIRSRIDTLSKYEGSRARFVCLIGVCLDGQTVTFYSGSVTGTIVAPRGDKGFGFDRVFEVEGATLAEDKSLNRNARYVACKNFLENMSTCSKPVIFNWDGSFQT